MQYRIHATIEVEANTAAPGEAREYEWDDVAKVETRILLADNAEGAAQMTLLDAMHAAVRMAGASDAWASDPEHSGLLAAAHAIAGVEPDGEARTAGDVAAFLGGEDDPVDDPYGGARPAGLVGPESLD